MEMELYLIAVPKLPKTKSEPQLLIKEYITMPTISIETNTTLDFIGLSLIALGILLILGGFGIFLPENIIIKEGKKTLILGFICCMVGIVCLWPEFIERTTAATIPTLVILSTPTASLLEPTPLPLLTEVPIPAPTDTPIPPTSTLAPTDAPIPPTSTPAPTDTSIPLTSTPAPPAPTDTPISPTSTPAPTDTPIPPTSTVPPDLPIATTTIGQSVQGRSINATRLGSGSRVVVIAGGLHGTERNAAKLVESISTLFTATSETLPTDFSFYFVPELNPDGLSNESRLNANGVDLNRNWDTDNWEPDTVGPGGIIVEGGGGTAPFSEPETIVFSEWLLNLQRQSASRLIVFFYHSAYPPSGGVFPAVHDTELGEEPDLESSKLAESFAQKLGYDYQDTWDSYNTTGEAINWCADHEMTCMDIELPSHETLTPAEVNTHVTAILSLLKN